VIAAIALVLLLQEPPAPERVKPARFPFDAGVDGTLWVADFDFRSATPFHQLDVESNAFVGTEIFARTKVAGPVWAGLSAETTFGIKSYVGVVSPELLLRLPLYDAIWEVQLRGRVLGGWLRIQAAPGDFDPAIGWEATIAVCCSPERNGWQGRFEIGVRQLEFDFNPDNDVITADDSVGGMGWVVRLGVEWWW